jgi:hypothetical protein
MATYEERWPIGTRQRVWLDVIAYTGLRRGDAVRIGRQHVRNGVATIKMEKGGFMVEVSLPILPILQATLDAGPCGDLPFIVGANGRPLTKESFGNEFKAACKAAGVPGSAHGVRKIAATRAADAGATEAQLMAIFGWTDAKMAALYTRTANRKRLAAEAMDKLNAGGTFIPAPSPPVRAAGEGGSLRLSATGLPSNRGQLRFSISFRNPIAFGLLMIGLIGSRLRRWHSISFTGVQSARTSSPT